MCISNDQYNVVDLFSSLVGNLLTGPSIESVKHFIFGWCIERDQQSRTIRETARQSAKSENSKLYSYHRPALGNACWLLDVITSPFRITCQPNGQKTLLGVRTIYFSTHNGFSEVCVYFELHITAYLGLRIVTFHPLRISWYNLSVVTGDATKETRSLYRVWSSLSVDWASIRYCCQSFSWSKGQAVNSSPSGIAGEFWQEPCDHGQSKKLMEAQMYGKCILVCIKRVANVQCLAERFG